MAKINCEIKNVSCIAFSPDGSLLAAGGGHAMGRPGSNSPILGAVSVWRTTDWSACFFRESPGYVDLVGFYGVKNWLVACRYWGEVDIHDVESGSLLGKMDPKIKGLGLIPVLSMSLDGSLLLGYGKRGSWIDPPFKLWELSDTSR